MFSERGRRLISRCAAARQETYHGDDYREYNEYEYKKKVSMIIPWPSKG